MLTRAFLDDPVFSWCLPEPTRRAEVLSGFFELVTAAVWSLGEGQDATSEHNRRLYQRHGFEVTAERSVAGSPPLWAMWREPRARSGG